MQYFTPFSCPDCGEHTFETEAELVSEKDLIDATCTNCGYALTGDEIAAQVKAMPAGAIQKMLADAAALVRRYSGH